MKAPSKGSGVELEDYGLVTVKMGPSPEEPFVWFTTEPHDGYGEGFKKLHIDEFKEQRVS